MSKSSFAVGFRINRETVVVLGVTSIVPNMNGVLFFTEDGKNYEVEAHNMKDGILPNMFIDYEQFYLREEIELDCARYTCIDHRAK